MPPRYPPRDRAWGSRYDTLNSSPPSTPLTKSRSPIPNINSPSTSLPLGPFSTLHDVNKSPQSAADLQPPALVRHTSIFVGSLPTNIEHAELTRLLAGHLSRYSQVKSVKVINDSKGGVCAFVQCESSLEAAHMLEDLRSQPARPFQGRILRYEPARAYRTLLISYRDFAPRETMTDTLRSNLETSPPDERPSALRIYRPQNAKHMVILYNDEALGFQTGSTTEEQDPFLGHDVFSGAGLLLPSMDFGAETIQTLVHAFGAVESLAKHGVADPDTERVNGPRRQIWEVKWENREDSVTAFVTLRRLPFLVVDWAHQATGSWGVHARREKVEPFTSPDAQLSAADVRLYLKSPHQSVQGSDVSSQAVARSEQSPHPGSPARIASRLHSPQSAFSPRSERWAFAHSTPLLGTPTSPLALHKLTLQDNIPFRWADEELPENPDDENLQSNRFSRGPGVATPEHHPVIPFTPTRARLGFDPSFRTPQSGARPEGEFSIRHGIFTPRSAKKYPRGNSVNGERVFDPTTVFIGGLDNSGSGSWDEEKLRSLFAAYGDIESVQVIRPLNKKSAFAFIRYENADAAARAVAEEHNQVHEGRQLRVQLRDINSGQRSVSKPGRGRVGMPFASPSRTNFPRNETKWNAAADTQAWYGRLGSPPRAIEEAGRVQAGAEMTAPLQDMSSSGGYPYPDQERAVPGPLINRSEMASGASMHVAETSSVASEPLSSSQSVAQHMQQPNIAAMPPTMMAPMTMHGFPPMPLPYYQYHYPSWVPAYPPHYAHHPSMPQAQTYPRSPARGTSPSSTETFNTQRASQIASAPPYPPMPYGAVPVPGGNRHTNGHPPLRPTGFIQGTQGMLVPVYQPEALDQYMSNTQQNPLAPGQFPSQPQLWPYYPHMPMYPYGFPTAPATASPAPSQPVSVPHPPVWTQNPPPYRPTAQQFPQRPYLPPTMSSSSVSTCSSLPTIHYPGNSPNGRRFEHRGGRQYGGPGQHGRGADRGQDFATLNPPQAGPASTPMPCQFS